VADVAARDTFRMTIGGDQLQLRVLEALEGAENYNRWVAELTLPYLGDDPIEVGSGLGGNAALWLDSGVGRVTVSELDPVALDRLEQRFADDPRIAVAEIDLEVAPELSHSAFAALNVLEHIADDSAALRGAARLVRPGGAVVVFVPAFPFAAGRFDRMIGHYRRYTKETIAEAYAAAGIQVDVVRYVNAPGLLAWFVSVKLLRQVPREGLPLRLWDSYLIPLVRRMERRWAPPFGQSLLAVGHTAK
jgi:SAM-dependent methyltransferase